MTRDELAAKIDLSLLRPDATKREVEGLLRGALCYPFASVCIPPCYVRLASTLLAGSPVRVGTVSGFPLGYQTTEIKVREAVEAFSSGALEIDVVMNISAFKSGYLSVVEEELSRIVGELPEAAVKVIIEAAYLTDTEKVRACGVVISSGAAFVKTSTGFAPGGAIVDDVRLLKEASAGRVRVKAAGGIKTLAAALEMIEAGADRIGTSSGIDILREF
ncbi:MAG TPA: deoxyribose-phosphate aldolase [Thermodesulfobacteriota bacterium]|nr:deoxyribose-phosphate aldolase [Thermodesulfobacteriota bacterium]